jgi:hypothetical protein
MSKLQRRAMTADNRNSTRRTYRSRDFYLWEKVARSDGAEGTHLHLKRLEKVCELLNPVNSLEICVNFRSFLIDIADCFAQIGGLA